MGRRNGTCPVCSDITGSRCRTGSVDPYRLSTERISEARFGFSAASSVSWHEARGSQPLPLMQIPQEKVRGPFDRARGHPADCIQMWTNCIDVFYLLRGHSCPSSAALAAVALFSVQKL